VMENFWSCFEEVVRNKAVIVASQLQGITILCPIYRELYFYPQGGKHRLSRETRERYWKHRK